MSSRTYITTKECRICKSKNLYDFLDLGVMPLPNEFIKKENLSKKEMMFPLRVIFCMDCTLVQLKEIVDPSIMFKNYLYIPSASKTRINHFKNIAESTKKRFKLKKTSLVVDIGSNDGSLLNCYKNLQINIAGIDPAENLVKIAELNGIPTILGYIDSKSVSKVVRNFGKADLALATNVIAHINDLYSMMDAVTLLLKDDGVFVMQFPYVVDLIENNQFDTIYHEHLSYFSVNSLMRLAQNSKLEIFDIERNDLDGGSIRVFWKKKKSKKNKVENEKINKMIENEKIKGFHDKSSYEEFSKRVSKLKKEVVSFLKKEKTKKRSIVGYGAAAKGNILLNYFGIDPKVLDYLVDSTPYKQGLYSPGVHIPIFEEMKIYETEPDYLLVLAWNFKDEIMSKNKVYKKSGGKFIIPNPKLEVI